MFCNQPYTPGKGNTLFSTGVRSVLTSSCPELTRLGQNQEPASVSLTRTRYISKHLLWPKKRRGWLITKWHLAGQDLPDRAIIHPSKAWRAPSLGTHPLLLSYGRRRPRRPRQPAKSSCSPHPIPQRTLKLLTRALAVSHSAWILRRTKQSR